MRFDRDGSSPITAIALGMTASYRNRVFAELLVIFAQ